MGLFVYISAMKILIICIAALFAQPKPPTFQQEFAAFDQALYDYHVAIGTNGDTITTKANMIATRAALSKYNVQSELNKIIATACRWYCSGQFYYYCINFAGNTHEVHLCMREYDQCVRMCGYIPF